LLQWLVLKINKFNVLDAKLLFQDMMKVTLACSAVIAIADIAKDMPNILI
jgi:hypothetical protein